MPCCFCRAAKIYVLGLQLTLLKGVSPMCVCLVGYANMCLAATPGHVLSFCLAFFS